MKILVYLLGLCLLLPGAASALEIVSKGRPDASPMPLPSALEACFSNPVDLTGGAVSSNIVSEFGLVSEAADDFFLPEDREIIMARWWGHYS